MKKIVLITLMLNSISFCEDTISNLQRTPVHNNSFYFDTLPPGFLSFEEFEKEFQLGSTTTEQLNPITKTLSQTMHQHVSKGLELLLDVDEKVVDGLEQFIPTIEQLAPQLADKIRKGGKVFLIGSGSSGRAAIEIAARCNLAFPETKQQILGFVAGGDSAFIRAREGFEDSEADGMKAFSEYNLGPYDTVILISASGSASFNVGCGHFSADQGAQVLYFYNSQNIPKRTQNLFDRLNNPVIPLCIDIGPQAIAGSTRLQGATLAKAGLGALLASSLYLSKGEKNLSKQYPHTLAAKLREGILLTRKHVDQIATFSLQEKEIFLDPNANFRQLRDISEQGYVTFLAEKDSIREVLIDATECSPTFSTNPVRRESEPHKRRAEFRAYLIEKENNDAWKSLLGRDIHPASIKDTEAFLLSYKMTGVNSYKNRPTGKGNFLIVASKVKDKRPLSQEMITTLTEAQERGAKVGILLLSRDKLSKEQKKQIAQVKDAVCVIENIPFDALGFSETIMFKQILNLISNGSMVLVNKIHGNQMIDMRASNNKLIDRCMRLVKGIWTEYYPTFPLSNKELYHYVAHVSVMKKSYEEKGIYTPSIVKIILAMVALNKDPNHFQEVLDVLRQKEERIDWIGNCKYKEAI